MSLNYYKESQQQQQQQQRRTQNQLGKENAGAAHAAIEVIDLSEAELSPAKLHPNGITAAAALPASGQMEQRARRRMRLQQQKRYDDLAATNNENPVVIDDDEFFNDLIERNILLRPQQPATSNEDPVVIDDGELLNDLFEREILRRPQQKQEQNTPRRRPRPVTSNSAIPEGQSARPVEDRKRRGDEKKEHHDDDNDEIIVIDTKRSKVERAEAVAVECVANSPEAYVIDIFPDADVFHIQYLLKKYAENVESVINDLMENKYPKIKQSTASTTKSGLVRRNIEDGNMANKWKYDYTSMSAFKPLPQYVSESKAKLLFDFPFLTGEVVKKIMEQNGNRYAISHDKILGAISNNPGVPRSTKTKTDSKDILQFERFQSALKGIELSPQQLIALRTLAHVTNNTSPTLKRRRPTTKPPAITEEVLLDEIQFVQHKVKTWETEMKKCIQRVNNQRAVEQAGTGVECSCCFGEYPIDDMVQCREAHLFCSECLRRQVETQVFEQGNLGIDKRTKQPALDILCFHGDGCNAGFERVFLEKALPARTLEKYEEVQSRICLQKAGLQDDLCSCPKCGFEACLPLGQKVFSCPVEDCLFDSCRECGEASHIPLRCEEVEREKETKGRLTVEEAITAAKIRNCPACKKGFVKSDGCNKIRCACGTFVCYVCRKKIDGYEHFCQVPHCTHDSKKCKKCPLWTKAEEDDARAMREAGMKAAAQVESEMLKEAAAATGGGRAKTAAGTDAVGSLKKKIDVDSILKEPGREAIATR